MTLEWERTQELLENRHLITTLLRLMKPRETTRRITHIVTLQMAPRTRRQAMADQKGKGIMIEEEEPQRTDRAEEPRSPDRESLASIMQPYQDLVRPMGPGVDEAGPSRPNI